MNKPYEYNIDNYELLIKQDIKMILSGYIIVKYG